MRKAPLLAVLGLHAAACGGFLGFGDDGSSEPSSAEADGMDASMTAEGSSEPPDASSERDDVDGGVVADAGADGSAACSGEGSTCTTTAACCASLACWEPGLIGSDASRCAPCAPAGQYSWGNPEYCCSKQQDDFFDCR
jgi:hypothetical protein